MPSRFYHDFRVFRVGREEESSGMGCAAFPSYTNSAHWTSTRWSCSLQPSSSTIPVSHSRWSPWTAKFQAKCSFSFQDVFQKYLEGIQLVSQHMGHSFMLELKGFKSTISGSTAEGCKLWHFAQLKRTLKVSKNLTSDQDAFWDMNFM